MKLSWSAWPSLLMALGLLSCLDLGAPGLPAGEGKPGAGPGLERLIEDLGSRDFEVREAATRALKEMDEAEAALRQALGSERVNLSTSVQ
jgi:HEAT repeat protein